MTLDSIDTYQCVPCSVGSYKETTGPQQCTLCADNQTTDTEGASLHTDCVGEYLLLWPDVRFHADVT